MTHIIDIEVFPNLYLIGIENYHTEEKFYFEISPYRDDRKEFYNWYSKYKDYLVTFNGEHYDNVVNNYFYREYDRLSRFSIDIFLQKMKKMSDLAIEGEYESIKKYKYSIGYTSIDLFLYWAKSLRITKKISLKSLAVQLGWDEIQELPYHHTTVLTREEIEIVKRYNLRNDLGISRKLFIEMQSEIGLRHYISQEYGLSCWSMDAPKIASEILLEDYCRQIFEPGLGIMYDDYKKSIRNTRHSISDMRIGDILEDFNPNFQIPQFQQLFEEISNSSRTFSKEFSFNYNDTLLKLSYGVGGLHVINNNECYKSDDDYIVVNSDFASLYPNIIINYKCIRFLEVLSKYASIKSDRLIAKKNKEKKKDTLFKLILNALSGLLDNEYSWMYFPEGALRMRIIGQLILTKLAEVTILNGWKVISLNTDGQEVIIPRQDWGKYQQVLKSVEQQFNLELEHGQYKFINYSNVNNYIAQTLDESSIKRKGLFRLDFNEKKDREIPLGDSTNELVIAKALQLYFVNGISIDESISNPERYNFHIYDYCKSNKISKNYSVYHNNLKVQNMNRYYFSKEGPFLFKKKEDKNTMEHVNVGEGVILFNKYEDKSWEEYKINYRHYTKKARDIINEIQTNQRQLQLF